MACNGDCIYLGTQVRLGVGFAPVCGFVAGPATFIDSTRPVCGSYKTEGAKNTEQLLQPDGFVLSKR